MNPMQKLILLFVAALVCGVMTACGPDLLELDPQEPSDLTVAQLVAKMNHATDPKGNYRDAKTYMMKQDLSSVKPGKKEYYATEIQFKAPDKMRTTTYRDGKAIWTYVDVVMSNIDSHVIKGSEKKQTVISEEDVVITSNNLNLADGTDVTPNNRR